MKLAPVVVHINLLHSFWYSSILLINLTPSYPFYYFPTQVIGLSHPLLSSLVPTFYLFCRFTNTHRCTAWIQISEGSEVISVIFRSPSGEYLHGGTVIAEQGCWSMLKGGIVATFSGPVDLTFEVSYASPLFSAIFCPR